MNSQNKQNDTLSIAHFSWEYPPKIWGGLGTFIAELTKQQKTMGHDITVFAVNDKNCLEPYQKWNDISVYRPKIIDFTDFGLHTYVNTTSGFGEAKDWLLKPDLTISSIINDYLFYPMGHLPGDQKSTLESELAAAPATYLDPVVTSLYGGYGIEVKYNISGVGDIAQTQLYRNVF